MSDSFGHNIVVSNILFSLLWLLGFAIIFAALSIHHYRAQLKNDSFYAQLQLANFQLPFWGGLALVTIGFAGNATTLWERIVWVSLAILTCVQVYFTTHSYQEERSVSNHG